MWDDYINHRIPQLQSYRTPKDPCQKNTSNFSHQSCTPPSQLKQCWWIQQIPKNWKTSLFFSRRGHLFESMVAHVSKSLYQTVSNKIDFQSSKIQFVPIEKLKKHLSHPLSQTKSNPNLCFASPLKRDNISKSSTYIYIYSSKSIYVSKNNCQKQSAFFLFFQNCGHFETMCSWFGDR